MEINLWKTLLLTNKAIWKNVEISRRKRISSFPQARVENFLKNRNNNW